MAPSQVWEKNVNRVELSAGQLRDFLVPINQQTEAKFVSVTMKMRSKSERVKMRVSTRHDYLDARGMESTTDWIDLSGGDEGAGTLLFMPTLETLPSRDRPSWLCITLMNPNSLYGSTVLSSIQITVLRDQGTQIEEVLGGGGKLARDFADLFLELHGLDESYRAEYVQFFSTNPQFHQSLSRLLTLREAKLHGRLQMAGEVTGTATGALFGYASSSLFHYMVTGEMAPWRLGTASAVGGGIGGYFAGRRAGLQAVNMEQAIYGGMKGGAVVGTCVGLGLTGGTLLCPKVGPMLRKTVKELRESPDAMKKLKEIIVENQQTDPAKGVPTPGTVPAPASPPPGPTRAPTGAEGAGKSPSPSVPVPKIKADLHKAIEKAIRPLLGEFSALMASAIITGGCFAVGQVLSNVTKAL